ncbi:MAG: TRAP transporter small permease [Spirochaetia bacterium]|nr:TRAP transporter small permease [Spirochaetia bacterium]
MGSVVKKFFSNFEEIFASSFIIITTVLVMMNVVLRYFFKTGIYWSEEVATGCFVWAVFLGSAAGYKRKIHVGVDMIINYFSPTTKYIVNIIVDAILLFINGYITYIAIIYLSLSYKKPTPVLGISSAFISSSILFSFAIMSIYSIRFLIHDIKEGRK